MRYEQNSGHEGWKFDLGHSYNCTKEQGLGCNSGNSIGFVDAEPNNHFRQDP